jgi:hypothetical protein
MDEEGGGDETASGDDEADGEGWGGSDPEHDGRAGEASGCETIHDKETGS